MTTKRLVIISVATGAALAAFVIVSMLRRFDLSLWLALNNLLVILSLAITAWVGFRAENYRLACLATSIFFVLVMFGYLVGYTLMTSVFVDQAAWVPFFDRDYGYHGFRSVGEYMERDTNFRDLLLLQIFSALIFSFCYFAAGSLGYLFRLVCRRSALTRISILQS